MPQRNLSMNYLPSFFRLIGWCNVQHGGGALLLLKSSSKACLTRSAIRSGGVTLLGAFLIFGLASAKTSALECPETGKGAVPALIAPAQEKLLAAGGEDMANEVNELIARLKDSQPGISIEEITNELVAAYCPIITRTSLSAEAKQNRVDTFGALVRKRLASETLAPGSSILATVPLSLKTYRALEEMAGKAGKNPDEYMSSILTKAAAEPEK
jgi:hypothetical protein